MGTMCICHVCCAVLSRSVMSNSFSTPWTGASQAPLSIEFSKQEYRSGLPFPTPGDLPNSRIESESYALAGGFFTTESPGKPCMPAEDGYSFFYLFGE